MRTVTTSPGARIKLPKDRRLFFWLLLALGAVAYVGFFAANPRWLPAVGVNYFGVWFLDSFAILASNDALARGLDVYAANPLDYLQRPHVYSGWWLQLGRLGLTRADNFTVGLGLMLAFFTVALAGLWPRSARELAWYLAVLCSSPVLLAVHRANNDLLIFILLAALVPCLTSARPGGRWLAGLVVAIATGLKFYPAPAGLLLLSHASHSSPRIVWRGLVVTTIAIALVLLALLPDLARLGAMLPQVKAEGLMTFGAVNAFGGLGLAGRSAVVASGVAGLGIAACFFRSNALKSIDVGSLDRGAWLRFVLGSVLLTACFFSGVNFAYRWIFAVWLAPFLWQAAQQDAPPQLRRFARVTGGLMIFALWADPGAAFVLTRLAGKVPGDSLVRWADRFFLAEQPLTWAFFACLLGWLVHSIRLETASLLGRRPTET